jgi:hypothetical protein
MILASHGIIASQIASFDADAVAFFNRVTTAGGTLSTTEKQAVNQLVLDLKANSLWTPMKAIYPMVGASAAACAQNLKSSSFTGTFSSGWTFASTGVTPNGTSAFMNTTLQMQQLSNTTNHLSAYMRGTISNGKSILGVSDGSSYTILGSATLNMYYVSYNSSFATSVLILRTGALLGNYISGNEKVFRNGVVQVSNTISNGSSASNRTYYLGCYNNAGTATQFIDKEIALASIGDGLTDTQTSNFYTAVQAFQTTLSRQV